MIKGFDFKDNDRTYTCTVEVRGSDPSDAWWWFAVTGDQQRYAPFRAAKADTQATVRERIVAYYENRRFQLTQPTVRGGKFRRQITVGAAATGAPAAVPVAPPAKKGEGKALGR